ncbi:MAG: signal recognition particle protein [Anaerolineae bacterium]
MFETLSERLVAALGTLAGRGKLTESDVDAALREVRRALLEADVHFRVARELVSRVRDRATGQEVARSLTPHQQVVRIVHEELIATFGEEGALALRSPPPHGIMLVGLQGSGKTTTAVKLALHLRGRGERPLMVATDTRRPAAAQQLQILGDERGVQVHTASGNEEPEEIAIAALSRARAEGQTAVLFDTQGRLQIDPVLMAELSSLRQAVEPEHVLLVADAMAGQEAVSLAETFHREVGLSGLILTKAEGDARGGAALSMRAVTGIPVLYLGIGERPEDLEPFHPDRVASRILGMGDVLTLIERAEEALDEEATRASAERILSADFTLEDFLDQLRQVKHMGPLSQVLELVPGFGNLASQLPAGAADREFFKVEAIINSMTPEERRDPRIIRGSRKRRIAAGSGTTPRDVNQLLGQFRQVQALMKGLSRGKIPGLLSRLG